MVGYVVGMTEDWQRTEFKYPMTAKWLGYLRVSTNAQATDGQGLELQADAIRSWVLRKGGKLMGFCEDKGVSGSAPLEEREGLNLAMYEAVRHGYTGVVVYRLDRLARDSIVQEMVLREFTKRGMEIHSTSDSEDALLGDDGADPARAMIRQILAAVFEFDRKMSRLRMAAGSARKRAAGGHAGGRIPFGYARNPDPKGPLLPVPHELNAIAQALTMRAMNASYRTIGEYWNTQGIRRRAGKGEWHPQSVKQILDLATRRGTPEPAELEPLARHFMGLAAR